MADSTKSIRLLFCMLLLEISLLIFQHALGGEVGREKLRLARLTERLDEEQGKRSYLAGLLELYETEGAELKQMMPQNIGSASKALSVTREKLDVLGITGEAREKSSGKRSVVIEAECEGTSADLAALLGCLREYPHTARLNRLTVESLGEQRLFFAAEIDFALGSAAPVTGQKRTK